MRVFVVFIILVSCFPIKNSVDSMNNEKCSEIIYVNKLAKEQAVVCDDNGEVLCNIDFEKKNISFNTPRFKYLKLRERSLSIAKNEIISKYGQLFWDKHVVFQYDGAFYKDDKYIGNWLKPLESIPDEIQLRFVLKLGGSFGYDNLLKITMSGDGVILNSSIFDNTLVSEMKERDELVFALDENDIHKYFPKPYELSNIYSEGLRLVYDYEKKCYNDFVYEVWVLKDRSIKGSCPKECEITNYFDICRVDPWSAELIAFESKIRIDKYKNGNGNPGQLIEDR